MKVTRVGIFLTTLVLAVGTVSCAPVQYNLTICSTEGGQVTTPGEDTYTHNEGTVISLAAEPEDGYHFVRWTGDVAAIADVNAATTAVTMNGHYSILANFGLDTWEIRDWNDLDAVRDNLVGRYILMNDLDSTTAGYRQLASPTANQGRGWESIGTSDDQFTGSLDGQGYETQDIFINRPDENYVGLFGEVGEEGVIKDVGVVNVSVIGNDYVGGLVGHSDGTLTDCYSTGSVTGEEHVGSLVGHNGKTVSNSHSSGNVTGDSRVGGLVGWNQATLSNSYSSCTVTGNTSVGGLVGDNWYYECTLSNSYATGSVTGRSRVGGLVGVNYYASVSNSYSTGSTTGSSQVGGLVGHNTGTVGHSFWDIETSTQPSSAGGTGKTTAAMKSAVTFSGAVWNIVAVTDPGTRDSSHIWNIVEGATYPLLSWQP